MELLARSLGPNKLLIFPGFRSNFWQYIVAFIGVSGVITVCPIYSFKIFLNFVRQALIVFYVMHDFSDFQFENIL